MIEPPPFFLMVEITDRIPRKQPRGLSPPQQLELLDRLGQDSPKRRMPALLARTLTGPNCSAASATSAVHEASS